MIAYKSINQQNATLEARESYYRTVGRPVEASSVYLQTCNRVELYYGEGGVPDEVARHLFRVTAGLESALVGERAVQGQVKEAYRAARDQYRLSAQMHKLFEYALLTGKRVRRETEISRGAVSHSLAAIEIIESEGVDLSRAKIAIIGVNKLTADILKFLKNKGAEMVFLANRSREKAEKLASEVGVGVVSIEEKAALLAEADILISATSAPHIVVRKEDIGDNHRLVAIDLAFPRDIDPEIGKIEGVKLYNIRDIEERVRKNIEVREHEVARAEAIIEEEIIEMQETLERRQRWEKSE